MLPQPTHSLKAYPTALTQSPAASCSARHHHAERALHHDGVDHFPAGHPVDAAACEGGGHPGQIGTGDIDGALTEVNVERVVRIAVEHSKTLQHIHERSVATAGLFSDAYTSRSMSNRRPAQAEWKSWIRANRSSGVAHGTKETAAMAPALIMGFLGVLVVSSTLISLNASSNGSTAIFASTAFWPSDRGQAHM